MRDTGGLTSSSTLTITLNISKTLIEPPVEPPATPQLEPPIEPPATHPVEPPAEPPITTPVTTPAVPPVVMVVEPVAVTPVAASPQVPADSLPLAAQLTSPAALVSTADTYSRSDDTTADTFGLLFTDFYHSSSSPQPQKFGDINDNADLMTNTSPSGGLVILGGDDSIPGRDGLYLVKTPSSQESLVDEMSSFTLPQGMFKHSNTTAKVKVEASLADGRPLPNWITFDPESGRFIAKPPLGSGGYWDIKVTARDQNGNVVETQFLFHITESKSSGSNAFNDGTDKIAALSDHDSDVPSNLPGTNAPNEFARHKHSAPQMLAGRPSLAEQMAALNQRSRMPLLFSVKDATPIIKSA
jgi:hypothetical protein